MCLEHVIVYTIPNILCIYSLLNDTILGMSKFKASADDKFVVAEKMGFVFERVENIVEKGENAVYSISSSLFSKGFFTVGR